MQTIKYKKGSKKAILFFNGWGMDHLVVPKSESLDLIIVQEYHTTGDLNLTQLKNYEEIYLVAWSMGVWAAEQQNLNQLNIVQAVAINGTSSGIDDLYGIPDANFQATYDHFSEIGLQKFIKRMCRKLSKDEFSKVHSDRSLENQKEELAWFIDKSNTIEKRVIAWSKAFIGTNDLIFPYENLKAFWLDAEDTAVQEIEMPHFLLLN